MTIQSILNQTYQNLETIIIENGSTDKTEEIVRGYRESRIWFVTYKANLGISVARNTGIKILKEYI